MREFLRNWLGIKDPKPSIDAELLREVQRCVRDAAAEIVDPGWQHSAIRESLWLTNTEGLTQLKKQAATTIEKAAMIAAETAAMIAAETAANAYIERTITPESFIDKVVERIRAKQLGA